MASPSPIRRLISSRALRERYGDKSARTIRRWILAGVLPPPDRTINGRHYWWQETIDRHERQLVTEKSSAFPTT